MKYRKMFGLEQPSFERDFDDIRVSIIKFMRDTKLNAVDLQGFVIAGGFLRKSFDLLPSPDVDLFCRDRKTMNNLVDLLKGEFITIISPNCTEIEASGFKVQVVHKEGFDTVEDLVNSIDFDACRIAWERGSDYLVYDDNFEHNARSRKLNYISSDRPDGSFKRALKFARRGYTPTEEGIERLLADLRKSAATNACEDYPIEPKTTVRDKAPYVDEYDPFAEYFEGVA